MRYAQAGAPTARSVAAQSAAPATSNSMVFSHTAVLAGSASKVISQSAATEQYSTPWIDSPGADATSLLQPASCAGDASKTGHGHQSRPDPEKTKTCARAGAPDGSDGAQLDGSTSSGMDTGQPQRDRPALRSILDEYRRLRAQSRAPSAVWLLGSPLLQVTWRNSPLQSHALEQGQRPTAQLQTHRASPDGWALS